MKKYVKPIMESEAFMANEYIGACWMLNCSCLTDGVYLSGTTMTNALYGEFGDSATLLGQHSDGSWIVTGELYGNDGSCTTYHEGLNQTQIGGFDCDRFDRDDWSNPPFGGAYINRACKFFEAITGNRPTTVTEAHHHATIVPTDKSNYSAHPNHS